MLTAQSGRLLAACTLVFACISQSARADNDFIVYSPLVVQGQSELETYGFNSQDPSSSLNGTMGYNLSIAHAVTSWWKPELYIGEFNRDPGNPMHLSGYEFENTFQLTEQGEYWADLGLVASYGYSTQAGTPDVAEFGPLLEKISGHIDQRLNLIWEKPLGSYASGSYAFRSAYSIGYNINLGRSTLTPGLEAYYRPEDHAHQIGPVLSGEWRTSHGSELEYSFGMVYGINPGAPEKTWLWRLEYEFF